MYDPFCPLCEAGFVGRGRCGMHDGCDASGLLHVMLLGGPARIDVICGVARAGAGAVRTGILCDEVGSPVRTSLFAPCLRKQHPQHACHAELAMNHSERIRQHLGYI
eukprot:6190232-Pleurochrysis_carterae.AAC.2